MAGFAGYLGHAEIDWEIAPLPKGPAGRFTLATNDGWSIWKGSKAPDATWELLKFLQSDEWTDIAKIALAAAIVLDCSGSARLAETVPDAAVTRARCAWACRPASRTGSPAGSSSPPPPA